jgi:cell division protein FtsI (penicillin-binding protein 3)
MDYGSRVRAAQSDGVRAGGRRLRLGLVGACAVAWSSFLVWRLFSLQIADFETWQEWALKQHFSELEVASERGPILDRNGKLLAVSVPAGSVYVRPRQVQDRQKVAQAIGKALDLKPKFVEEKLKSKQPFVWVKRQMPRIHTDELMALKLPGVGSVIESRRFYPYNAAASALIGRVGVDGTGLSGVESLHEKVLHAGAVKARVGRDAFGKTIQVGIDSAESFSVPKGEAVQLSIDADVQLIVDEEVALGREAARSKSALAVMLNAETGEVLALSQAPSFNFNVPQENSKDALRNLLVESVFEPGSTMKPIVAAAALEVRAHELIDCENGRFPFGKHTIKDVHPVPVVSFHDVVVRSSNIGMTKIGMRMGAERLHQWLHRFGFGESTNLGLAGETSGILRPLTRWSRVDVATHAFGQGVAVTPLQVVRAVAAIANGGYLPPIQVVQSASNDSKGRTRILSPQVAQAVRDMMVAVVEDKHGTGSKARVEGYRIGGKTGTAQKASQRGGYAAGSYVASFVGFVDGRPVGIDANLVLMVVVDEPSSGAIYGGVLAAPVFQKIVARTMKLYANRRNLEPGVEDAPHDFIRRPDRPGGRQPEVVAQSVLPTLLN